VGSQSPFPVAIEARILPDKSDCGKGIMLRDERDQDAEWKIWEAWLAYISDRVTKIPGVTTEYVQPVDQSSSR
jgi:hypothetical protein